MRKSFFLTALSIFIITFLFFALNILETKTPSSTFSYISNPDTKMTLPPSATISGSAQVCKDSSPLPEITLTASGGTQPYTFSYTINNGVVQRITVTGGNSLVLANLTNVVGVFEYRLVEVEDSLGEISTINRTATITVTEPIVDFTFDNNAACSGTSVNFTPNATGNAPFTYSWSFGDGTTSNNSNPSHIFSSLGCGFQNANVTLTVTDANGCTNSITKAISIQQKPLLEFRDIDNAFDPFNNCGNNTTDPSYTINVGIQNVSASCINSYDVNWGDGSPVEANVTFPATHTYTQLGSFNMQITGRGPNCDNTVSYLIKNSSNPTGSIVNPGNTVNLCTPVSPIEFAIGTWATNPPDTNYFIDFGDGTTESYTQAQLEASPFFNTTDPINSQNFPIPHTYTETSCPNSYTVFLFITTSCGQTNLTAGPIIILRKPEVAFEDPPTSCVNQTVQFNNTSLNGFSNNCSISDGYFWDFGDGTTSTLRDPSHSYSTPGNYTISLHAQNSCGITDTITKNICIEPALNTSFTLDTNNGCSPLAIQTTNTTDLSSSCGGETYLWEVAYTSGFCGTGAPQWNFTNGTNENSAAPSINFITAGTYTLNLTTTNSCGTSMSSNTIEVKQPPTSTIEPIADFCGNATINPIANIDSCTPASETLTYSWLFPGGTPTSVNTLNPGTITYTTPGNYQILFSITNSCGTTTDTEEFVVNPIPNITNTNLSQTICSGTDTAEVTLTSDIPNTTFSWTATAPAGVTGFISSGNTNTIPVQTIFNANITSEDVIFTITPSLNGCDGTPVNLTITVDPAPSFTSQPQPETICLNGAVNTLSISVNGPGTTSYQWYSNTINDNTTGVMIAGETNATFAPPNTPIGITFYYCVVSFTSGAGCNEIVSNTARIEIVDGIQIDTQPLPTQNLCNGGTIANSLSVVHSGGTGIVTYQWYSNTINSNIGGTIITGATNINFNPSAFTISGSYYYYVVISQDGSGCSDITSNVAEILVVDDPVITTQPLPNQTICQNTIPSNLEVFVNGGLGSAYTYQWFSNTVNSNSGGTLIPTATNSTFTPSSATVGTLFYYVEITQVEPGCMVISNTSEVTINTAPTLTLQPVSETICFGETFNTLSVNYANGVGIPTYQWYSNTVNDTTTGNALAGEINANFTPNSNSIGTVYYYAIITFSSGGCTEITSNISEQTVNETPNITDKSQTICSGTSFNITPNTNGTDTVPLDTLYTWGNPIINPVGAISGALNETTGLGNISQTLINNTTAPATVSYTVTPISGICAGTGFNVTITVNPSISITETITNSTCFATNSGSIEISITGGVPFNTGNPYQISWSGTNAFTSTDEDIFNLEPGSYTVVINDDGGCPFTNTFTITEPEELLFSAINFNPETISCFEANDGTIGIDVSGGTMPYTYNWTRNGVGFATTEDLVDLSPGNYEVTVSDANNCTPIIQNFQITEPPLLEVGLINQVDIICFGNATGQITISTIGGRPTEISPGIFDYRYSWTGPNGFTSSLQNLTNVFSGTYNLTVTDASGCTDTLQVILNQSDDIIIDFTKTEIVCYGDNNASIIINSISGGNPPYTITWSNLGSGNIQNNLSAGTYIITVTDSTNCQKQATVVIDEAPIFRITPLVSQISCFGENNGRIVLNLEGGIAPVNLVWNDNATAGVERNNLGPGTYTVTITDGTPCEITETFVITEPAPLNLTANTTDALNCDDANSGALNLIATGGTLPLTYTWSNGITTEDLNNIPPGNYTVQVTDANGCNATGNWTINRFDPLTVDVETITDFNCETRTVNQTFVAKPTGGVPPYQLNWSSGIVSGANNDFMNTSQDGLVVLNVTDGLGCSANYSFNVDIPVLGFAGFTQNSIGFATYGFYSKLDVIQFTNTATGNYTSVSWNFGDGNFSAEENPTHTYTNEGTYVVTQTVTYPFGCVYTQIITLIIEKGYSLIMPDAFTPNNDGLNDFFAPESIALSAMVFNVYNTWGSLIYSESGDDLQGWDGNVSGAPAENGNYYYTLTAKTFYGETITKEGAFTSIK